MNLSLGLGWERIHRGEMLIIDKNGAVPGFSTYIGMVPEKKIAIAIFMNQQQHGMTQLGRKLLLRLAHNTLPHHHRKGAQTCMVELTKRTLEVAPGQNRTDARSLEGYCSTIELQARKK